MTTPVISIILPTFNGSKYLEEAVSSCRCQAFSDWELIIVDDASTDITPELIARLEREDSRIRSIRHRSNMKLPASLNAGFTESSAPYVTWTSDDNLYEPAALATLYSFLSATPDVDVVYADYVLFDDNGAGRIIPALPPEYLVLGNVVGPCFLYRRSIQEILGGYDDSLFLAEDYDFWLRASTVGRMAPLNRCLYRYRLHPDSLTSQNKTKIDLCSEAAVCKNLPRMKWLPAELKAISWLNAALRARKRHDTIGFLRLVARGLLEEPLFTFNLCRRILNEGDRALYDMDLSEFLHGTAS